jgi:hypothetical protein
MSQESSVRMYPEDSSFVLLFLLLYIRLYFRLISNSSDNYKLHKREFVPK